MAVDPTIIEDAIEKAASAPKDATSGDQRVVQHSLRDLMTVLDRAEEDDAATRRTLPVRLFKIRPGSAVGGGR